MLVRFIGNCGQQPKTRTPREEVEILEVTGKLDLFAHRRAVCVGTPERAHC